MINHPRGDGKSPACELPTVTSALDQSTQCGSEIAHGIFIVKDTTPTEVSICVLAKWEIVQSERTLFLESLLRTHQVPGFRKGKAPMKTLIRHIGVKEFNDELKTRLANKVYQEQVKNTIAESEAPLMNPKFEHGEIEEDKSYEFTIKWQIDPRAVLEQAQQQGISPEGHAPEMPGAGPTGGPQPPTPQIHAPNSHDVPGPPDVGPNMPGGIPRPPGFDPYR